MSFRKKSRTPAGPPKEGRSGLVRGLVKVDTGVDSTSPSKSGLGARINGMATLKARVIAAIQPSHASGARAPIPGRPSRARGG